MRTVVPGKQSDGWFVPKVKSGEVLVIRENL
jgi:hypothetical protein